MARPISLCVDGKLMVDDPTRTDVDIVLTRFEAKIERAEISVVARKSRWFARDEFYDCAFPFADAVVERIDDRRNALGAVKGALVGNFFAGSIGLLAGAAAGADVRYVVVVHCGPDNLILDVSSEELHALVARGVVS